MSLPPVDATAVIDMKFLLLTLGLAFSFASSASYGIAAELNGRIVITKKFTKKRVTLPAYQLRGVSSAAEPDDSGPVNEYKEVVVFLEGDLPKGNLPNTNKPVQAELQQRHHRFEPQLLVIPVGSTVSFPNADPLFHNVFSLSNTKKFDLGYYPAGQTRVVKFDEHGVVQVYCHLHPNMYAAIVVVPNRWYARPADDGTFSLRDIPPGNYHLVAWHMSAGFFRKQVHVPASGDGDVSMNIPIRDEEHSR
jgi:plastocyanin